MNTFIQVIASLRDSSTRLSTRNLTEHSLYPTHLPELADSVRVALSAFRSLHTGSIHLHSRHLPSPVTSFTHHLPSHTCATARYLSLQILPFSVPELQHSQSSELTIKKRLTPPSAHAHTHASLRPLSPFLRYTNVRYICLPWSGTAPLLAPLTRNPPRVFCRCRIELSPLALFPDPSTTNLTCQNGPISVSFQQLQSPPMLPSWSNTSIRYCYYQLTIELSPYRLTRNSSSPEPNIIAQCIARNPILEQLLFTPISLVKARRKVTSLKFHSFWTNQRTVA